MNKDEEYATIIVFTTAIIIFGLALYIFYPISIYISLLIFLPQILYYYFDNRKRISETFDRFVSYGVNEK